MTVCTSELTIAWNVPKPPGENFTPNHHVKAIKVWCTTWRVETWCHFFLRMKKYWKILSPFWLSWIYLRDCTAGHHDYKSRTYRIKEFNVFWYPKNPTDSYHSFITRWNWIIALFTLIWIVIPPTSCHKLKKTIGQTVWLIRYESYRNRLWFIWFKIQSQVILYVRYDSVTTVFRI